MSNNDNNSNLNLNQTPDENTNAPVSLSDEQRVKVMSPGMLVIKRFIRNRLAVIGFIILAVMFLFSFVGPLFTPYEQAQQFVKNSTEIINYAQLSMPKEWYFTEKEGAELSKLARLEAIKYIERGQFKSYVYKSNTYKLEQVTEEIVNLYAPETVVTVEIDSDGDAKFTYEDRTLQSPEFEASALAAIKDADKMATFTINEALVAEPVEDEEPVEGEEATIPAEEETVDNEDAVEFTAMLTKPGKGDSPSQWTITKPELAGIASKLTLRPATQEYTKLTGDYNFIFGALNAYSNDESSFTADRVTYKTEKSSKRVNSTAIHEMNIYKGSTLVARLVNYLAGRYDAKFLGLDFIDAYFAASVANEESFILTSEIEVPVEDGEEGETELQTKDVEFYVSKESKWVIKYETQKLLGDNNAAPSSKHILGTDGYGMDVATRLMYGGQVSLMVGFIVIAIETVIGVILGGIAGYFSGWVDVAIMRLIELFNCIPFYPMLMIIGSLLDANHTSPEVRIYLLMVILGLLGWPGIARIVRGQILSLREQDFMVATEASGLPIPRRIFRHLLPNVIPLLIVQATMGLGGIIITEATLSYLGLGVKYPLASWGAIINQASDQFVMTNYWWIWIPAGMLILLTVLGFNFVGDGLRDAFDPKMKR